VRACVLDAVETARVNPARAPIADGVRSTAWMPIQEVPGQRILPSAVYAEVDLEKPGQAKKLCDEPASPRPFRRWRSAVESADRFKRESSSRVRSTSRDRDESRTSSLDMKKVR